MAAAHRRGWDLMRAREAGAVTIPDRVRMRWSIFSYNFGWSKYADILDGWIPRLSFAVPLVGYLILFNDSIAQHLTFRELTSGHSIFGLSGSARLKFIYLGLLALGIANILFRWRQPYVIRIGREQFSYVEMGLKHFTLETYIDLHGRIRHSDRDAYTRHGKYYDADWDAFLESAAGENISAISSRGRDPKTAHWVEAKAKYESLLRSILIESFFREDTTTRRGWLILCLAVAAVGYGLLVIPSFDLLVRVIVAIFAPLLVGAPLN